MLKGFGSQNSAKLYIILESFIKKRRYSMFKLNNIFILASIFMALLYTGCENEPTSVEPLIGSDQITVNKLKIPEGATVDSAAFYINATSASGAEVTLHSVTTDWDETTVTWNNFSGSFNPDTAGLFTPGSAGWYVVDITALVNEWVENINPNYGVLLKETDPGALQTYTSREAGMSPYLKIWWTLNGSMGFDSTDAFADAFINSDSVNTNYGDSTELMTGWSDTTEYQTLVRFEIEKTPVSGCTRGYGYWKTHSVYGPAPYNSTWALLGEDSLFFLSNQTNYEVMWTAPKGGNAYYILAHKYIAVELNFLAGADPTAVQTAFDDATTLFNTYTPEEIGDLKGNNPIRKQFIELAGILSQYNDGEIGPGSCGDSNYSDIPLRIK